MSLSTVSLTALNTLRNAEDPIPMRTLRRLAANGMLPGAVWTGTRWRVVLDSYDKHIQSQLDCDEDRHNEDVESIAQSVLMKLGG